MNKINVYSINARQAITQGIAPKYVAVDFIGLCTYAGVTKAIIEMEDGVLEEHTATNLQVIHEDERDFPVEIPDMPEVKRVDTTKTTGVTETPVTTGVNTTKKVKSKKSV